MIIYKGHQYHYLTFVKVDSSDASMKTKAFGSKKQEDKSNRRVTVILIIAYSSYCLSLLAIDYSFQNLNLLTINTF